MLSVRTTLTLDEDLALRLKELAQERGVPFKRVVNETIRNGLDGSTPRKPFKQKTYNLDVPRMDLTKANQIAAAMDDEEFIRKMREQR